MNLQPMVSFFFECILKARFCCACEVMDCSEAAVASHTPSATERSPAIDASSSTESCSVLRPARTAQPAASTEGRDCRTEGREGRTVGVEGSDGSSEGEGEEASPPEFYDQAADDEDQSWVDLLRSSYLQQPKQGAPRGTPFPGRDVLLSRSGREVLHFQGDRPTFPPPY